MCAYASELFCVRARVCACFCVFVCPVEAFSQACCHLSIGLTHQAACQTVHTHTHTHTYCTCVCTCEPKHPPYSYISTPTCESAWHLRPSTPSTHTHTHFVSHFVRCLVSFFFFVPSRLVLYCLFPFGLFLSLRPHLLSCHPWIMYCILMEWETVAWGYRSPLNDY